MSVMAWKRYDRITSYSRHSGQRRFLVLKAASCRSACVLLAAPTDGNRCTTDIGCQFLTVSWGSRC